MAEEKTRRPPAKKTRETKAAKTVPATTAGNEPDNNSQANSASGLHTTTESDNVPTATAATARNTVVEGNGTVDIDAVRLRAYELYQQRRGNGGAPEDDWLRAETELLGRNNGRKSA